MKIPSPSLTAFALLLLVVTTQAEDTDIRYTSPEETVTRGAEAFDGGKPIYLRSLHKTGLCLTQGATGFRLEHCGQFAAQQVFFRDSSDGKIKNYADPSECIVAEEADANLHARKCTDGGQPASYDAATRMIVFTSKPALCIDDSGAWGEEGDPHISASACNPLSMTQHFVAHQSDVAFAPEVLEKGTSFKLCGVDDECLADTGALADTKSGIELSMRRESDLPYATASTFIYDKMTSQIKSLSKPELCVSNGQTFDDVESPWTLEECDSLDIHQKFIYSSDFKRLVSSGRRNLCLDSKFGWGRGGSVTSKLCSFTDRPSQTITIVSSAAVKEVAEETHPSTPAELPATTVAGKLRRQRKQ